MLLSILSMVCSCPYQSCCWRVFVYISVLLAHCAPFSLVVGTLCFWKACCWHTLLLSALLLAHCTPVSLAVGILSPVSFVFGVFVSLSVLLFAFLCPCQSCCCLACVPVSLSRMAKQHIERTIVNRKPKHGVGIANKKIGRDTTTPTTKLTVTQNMPTIRLIGAQCAINKTDRDTNAPTTTSYDKDNGIIRGLPIAAFCYRFVFKILLFLLS